MMNSKKLLKMISLGVASIALVLPMATKSVQAKQRVNRPRIKRVVKINHNKSLKRGVPKFLIKPTAWQSKKLPSDLHFKGVKYMRYDFTFTKHENTGSVGYYNKRNKVIQAGSGFGNWWKPHFKQVNKRTFIIKSGGYKNHYARNDMIKRINKRNIKLWTNRNGNWKYFGRLTAVHF